MKLLEEIQGEGGSRRSQLSVIIEALSGDDLRDFIEALNNKHIPHVAIARVMQRRGFKLDPKRVSEYRLGSMRYGSDGKPCH